MAELSGPADWVVPEAGPGGETGLFLRHVDGHCVFLLPDNRCAVHARWGGEAKPGFCQEFPYRRLRDPNGEVLVIRAECGGLHASHVDGDPLAAQTALASALPTLRPTPEFRPEAVAILPGVGASLADWMALERSLLACWEAVDADAAEPEDTARALARAAVQAVGRSLPPGRTALAADAVREAMRMVANAAIAQETPATEAWQRTLVRQTNLLFDRKIARSAEGSDGARRLSEATKRYLHTLLGQAILGKHLVAAGGFVAMLGRFVFECDLVRSSAGSGQVTPAEASAVLVPWLRFADNPMVLGMLRRATPALLELAAPPARDVPTIAP